MLKIKTSFFALLMTAAFTVSVLSADLVVTKIADTNDGICDADCSLREAISVSNASPEADSISFAPDVFGTSQTITLSNGEMSIQNVAPVRIIGPGADLLTINANNLSRILTLTVNSVANVYGITFTGGNGVGALNPGRAGAVYNAGGILLISHCTITGNTAANGGGLNNASSGSPAVPGNLTIVNSVVSGNTSTSSGGGLQNFSTSTINIEGSLFTDNQSGGTTGGGAIQANGIVRISNTTISGNRAPGGTGAGIQSNGGDQILTNVTITNNTSTNNGGGIHRASSVAGLFVRNSLIAGNIGLAESPDVTNITNGTFVSQGNNLIGNVGTSTGWIGTDVINTDPQLTPLGFHGGSTMTHALLSSSPAINAGSNCVLDLSCMVNNPPVSLKADQRGAARYGGTVDIGSYEANAEHKAFLPSAVSGQPYELTLVPSLGSFTYTLSSGGFADMTFSPETMISGTPSIPGAFDSSVLITGSAGTATIGYKLNVLNDSRLIPVSGRVLTANNTPIGNVSVSLTDLAGNSFVTLSNPFGYFQFNDVPKGNIYVISGTSRTATGFTPTGIYLSDAINTLTLYPAVIPTANNSERSAK